MTSDKVIKTGVIGLGRIGRIHAENVARCAEQARLFAVADPNLDRAYAVRLGVETGRAHTDPERILADPEIEAVIICTPTDTHVELIKAAAAAKKAVFCEKPVSHDPDKIEAAARAARQAGVPVQIGFNRRFDPNFRAAQAKIAAGLIGRPRIVTVISHDPAPPPPEYVKRSGGMLFDMSIHDFDMVRFLAGDEVVEVFARGANLVDPRIGEAGDIDTAVVTLVFRSGAIGSITNCREAAYGYDQRIEVLGSLGAVRAENVLADTTVLSTKEGVRTEKPLHFFLERYAAAYRAELAEFFAAVREGRAPSVGLEDVKQAALIARAATESAKSGRPVKLTS